jgi:hypothetical protein
MEVSASTGDTLLAEISCETILARNSAIYLVELQGAVNIRDSTFSEGTFTAGWLGIVNGSLTIPIVISGCNFTNTDMSASGVISVTSRSLFLEDCYLEDISAGFHVFSVLMNEPGLLVDIHRCTLINDHTRRGAQVIYAFMQGSSMVLRDSTFTWNHAGSGGQAIFLRDADIFHIIDCNIELASTGNGCILSLRDGRETVIERSTITESPFGDARELIWVRDGGFMAHDSFFSHGKVAMTVSANDKKSFLLINCQFRNFAETTVRALDTELYVSWPLEH